MFIITTAMVITIVIITQSRSQNEASHKYAVTSAQHPGHRAAHAQSVLQVTAFP